MKAIDLVGRVFGQRTAGAIERGIHILRNRYAPPCTCPQAVQDFAAIAHGSLDVEGLLRLARHTSHCLSCRDLLTTLVLTTGLRRVVRAGLQEMLPASEARPHEDG